MLRFLFFSLLFTNLHAVKWEESSQFPKCAVSTCDQVGDKFCAKCKSAHYCGREHQQTHWGIHKKSCQNPFPSEEMAIAQLLISRPIPVPVKAMQAERLTDLMEAYVKSRGDLPKILIVGCGKKPYDWQEGKSDVNYWRDSHESNFGDHTHADAFTVAEHENVQPNGLWDWLNPIPKKIDGWFDVVYFEKLPPRVLAQNIVFENALKALKKGGSLEIDMQTTFISYIGVDRVFFFTPFEMILPTSLTDMIKNPTIDQGMQAKAKHREEFAKIVNSPEPLKALLGKHGFTNISLVDRENNPYNGRTKKSKTGFAKKP